MSERQKQFLERREALHAAELDQAKAAKKVAETQQKALEMELQLSGRRDDRSRVAGDPTATLRQDEVIRELERKTLEAQRQRAEAAKDWRRATRTSRSGGWTCTRRRRRPAAGARRRGRATMR